MDNLGGTFLEDPCTLPFDGDETDGTFDVGNTPFGGLP